MKKIFFAFGAALLLAACNSGLGSKEAEAPQTTTTTPTFTAPATGNSVVQADSANPSAAGAATSVKLNPKHGMPGHRCDIPEGAPLASAPVQGAVLPGAGNVALPANPAAPAAGVKLNPPHGQPGHSCDVPVGQPLN